MDTVNHTRKIALILAVSLFGVAVLSPDRWFGSLPSLHAEDDEGEMESDDDGGGSDFDGEDLEDMSPRERREYIREETGGMRLGEKLQFLNEFNQALQEQRTESQHEQQYEREEQRLDWLHEHGLISEDKYDQLLDQAADRLGIQDPDYTGGGYENGWEDRQQYYQQNNSNWDTQQKALNLDYVKHGDRPLEADEGISPKPNPLLENPVVYDAASASRLADAVSESLKNDVAGLRKSLPDGCRIEDAVSLIEKLKGAGGSPALIEKLQAALVDRDVRLFERSAQALLVSAEETQRLLIGLTMENLQDSLEDNSPPDEIRKITEPMVRRVDQAGLEPEFSAGFAAWLQSIPDLLKTRQQLTGAATAAWPTGDVPLIFDPRHSGPDARILPGGLLVAAAEGEARITVGLGNKYTASGIPVLKGASANTPPTTAAKPETPSLQLSYPGDSGDPVKYSITCYMDIPTQVADKFQPREAWKQDYTIKPGLKQTLPLAWNGRIWYLISCPTKNGSGKPKPYSLKPESGVSPTYAFRVVGNDVTVVSTLGTVTLDNSRNSRSFLYMEGNRYCEIRAGGKKEFDTGMTLRYARNGKTTPPKDANGQPIAGAAAVATDISTITLRGNETGVIGVNSNGDWEIRQGGELLLAERKEVNLPVVRLAGTEKSSAGATENPTPSATPRGKLYIMAIGIAKYKNSSQFPSLAFADKDVTAVADILKKQEKTVFQSVVPPIVLLNEQATAINIRTQLVGLEKKVTKNDTVALIISGHGVMNSNEYYFCPQDTDAAKITKQGISSKELQQVTDNLSARNVFMFLDSCYSGGATDKLQQTFENKVAKVGDSGVVIFASSKGTESSQEDPAWGHGALTKAFLDSVSNPDLDLNNDSVVQIVELDNGLTEGVKKLTGGGQHVQSAELGAAIRNLSLVRYNTN